VSLILDQELARTGGGTLLTAISPLVMAAAAVPGHRQARFASLQVNALEKNVGPGIYVAVLAKAVSASRAGDEIWGCAVTLDGRSAGDGPVNALLAALAEGRLIDEPLPAIDRLETLAERAVNQLDLRHVREQSKRDSEFDALKDSRRITFEDQHRRRVEAIENRIETAQSRGRGDRSIDLFRSQLRRAEEKNARLISELEAQTQPEIRLEALAACVLHIVTEPVPA
jgi:hypothetical protein